MILNLSAIRAEVHNKYLAYRNWNRTINTNDFDDALKIGKLEDVIEAINKCDNDAVLRWIRDTMTKEFGDKSIRQLRNIAFLLKIPYYTSKTKSELVSIIQQERDRLLKNAGTIKETA